MSDIKQPTSPRAQENALARALQFITDDIAKSFKSDVLDKLDKKTVDKFEDAAQTGNYAAILLKLSGRMKRKILKKFNNDAIQALVTDYLMKADKATQRKLYNAVEGSIGISTKQLMLKESMSEELNALVLESSVWVQKLRDESLEAFTNNTLFAMTNGKSLSEIMTQFTGIKEERKGHAKYLAHNQIQNFNAITSKIRMQKLGVTRAIWDTAGDESVRHSHEVRDGKEFDIAKGLYSSVDRLWLLPGIDHGCRCTARYILDTGEVEE